MVVGEGEHGDRIGTMVEILASASDERRLARDLTWSPILPIEKEVTSPAARSSGTIQTVALDGSQLFFTAATRANGAGVGWTAVPAKSVLPPNSPEAESTASSSWLRPFSRAGQLVAVGEDGTATATRHAVDGESALGFPTLDRALGAAEEAGNFLPRIQTLALERVGIGCHMWNDLFWPEAA